MLGGRNTDEWRGGLALDKKAKVLLEKHFKNSQRDETHTSQTQPLVFGLLFAVTIKMFSLK